MASAEALLKNPLYVYDLPQSLLSSLQLRDDAAAPSVPESETNNTPSTDGPAAATSCGLCSTSYNTVADQRVHAKSDFHRFNLKRKLHSEPVVSEAEFEKLLDEDLNESISGSESETDSQDENTDNDPLATLLRKNLNVNAQTAPDYASSAKVNKGRSPEVWLTSPLLPSEVSLGVYRALFSNDEQEEGAYLSALAQKQLPPSDPKATKNPTTTPHVFMCMIGGGHFAAMIVSLAPKLHRGGAGGGQRQAEVLAHKTFHRYTTRRKQGGAQSASDASGKVAHSAGSSLRRYNEQALTDEIRALLTSWKSLIDTSELLFIRATGANNRKALFGYDGAVLKSNDTRIRGFPFSTRRATQSELLRCFVELTRVKVSRVTQEALAAAAKGDEPAKAPKTVPKPEVIRLTKEEEEATLHTGQIQALINRSKAPSLVSYLTSNGLTPEFRLFPPDQNYHAPTPLHLSASSNSPAVVSALLIKANGDPSVKNGEGKMPFELAGDRATRDAFRISRFELGEDKWNWDDAKVPPPLKKTDAEQRDRKEKEAAENEEKARRNAEMERLKEEEQQKSAKERSGKKGQSLGAGIQMGFSDRQQKTQGLSEEAKKRLEREQRARAAEERIRKLQGGR